MEQVIQDNYIRNAEVVRVVDGDTYELIIDGGHKVYHKRVVRLLGYNTPEVFGKEKEEGLRSSAYVKGILQEGTKIKIRSEKEDNFGRWLCDVWFYNSDGELVDLGKHLHKLGFAKEYRK